ncbi:hypothetical protein RKD32_003039 [Streptomyces sp. SAI-195]
MPVRFLKVWLCQVAVSGQGAGPFIEVTPLSMSMAAVMIFMVEPGATVPWKAALNPSVRLFATASTSPELGFTATTEDSPYRFTAFSAAACTLALRVVSSFPGLPSVSVSSGVSGASAAACRTASSTPGVPPALSPYFSRSLARIGPSEGYFSLLSTAPSRPTAWICGVADSAVTRVSPSFRSGWTTEGFQSTSARPLVSPRTTVSVLL